MKDWVLRNSDTYLPLLTLIVYILNWRKIAKQELILFFYLVVNVILFGITNLLADRGINNLFLYHLYSLLDLIAVTYYLSVVLLKRNRLFYSIAIGYSCFWGLNILIWESLSSFNSNAASLANLIILILSMYYLLQLSKSEDILNF